MARVIRVVVLFLAAVSAFAPTARAQALYATVSGADSPLYVIDTATLTIGSIGNIGYGITGLAFHPVTGELYGTQGGAPGNFARNLIRIDVNTGQGTIVGPLGTAPGGVADIAFSANGTLYGWSEQTDDLVTINLTTGAATVVGNAGIATRGSGLAFNAAGTLYLAGNNGNGPLRTVNPATGLTTAGPTLSGAPYPTMPIPAMKFHPVTDELWAFNRQTDGLGGVCYLIRINPATGAITTVANFPLRLDAMAFAPGAPPDVRRLDFDDDRKEDLLFRNSQAGALAVALMNGATVKQGPVIIPGVPLAWQIAGVGDLDADARADIVARNSQTGAVGLALMNGTTVLSTTLLASPLARQIAGVADLNGDRKADIVFRDTQTGDVVVWLMNGATVLSSPVAAPGVSQQWAIQAVNDLDGDLKADIVARHLLTGQVAVAFMNGGTILSVSFIPPPPLAFPLSVQIVGVDDLSGDRRADILWRSTAGEISVTLMNGATIVQSAVITSGVGANVEVQNLEDVNGDGRADIIARNLLNGDVIIALMDGTKLLSTSVALPGVPLAWRIH
jgi:hypothetical protein